MKLKLAVCVMMMVLIVSGCGNKKESSAETASESKETVYEHDTEKTEEEKISEQQMQKSPSELFASGAVFDICRQNRDVFLQAINDKDALELLICFIQSYSLFLENPEVVGFTPEIVNADNTDTDPGTWNADFFTSSSGDSAALLFMPVENDAYAARIVGIIFSDNGDGYYYCMLNKDETVSSDVFRNKAMLGIENAGTVMGLGEDLMNDFLNCMSQDYYK